MMLSSQLWFWISALTIMNLLGCNLLRSFPGVIRNWPPYTEGRERPKKKDNHCRLFVCTFNKQRNLLRRPVLVWHKWRFLHTFARIFKIYMKALARVIYMPNPDGLIYYQLSPMSLSSFSGKVGMLQHTFQAQWREWGASNCLSPALRSSQQPCLLDYFTQQNCMR